MKMMFFCLTMGFFLSTLAGWSLNAEDRFKGGSYDGSDQDVTPEYVSLKPPPMGTVILFR